MKIFILLLTLFLLCDSEVFSYDNVIVHRAINETSSMQSINIARVLNGLGFRNNIDASVWGQKVYAWIRAGGKAEDEPDYRTTNHFHDPLRPWNAAGFKGSWLGSSSLLWAQNQKVYAAMGRVDASWPRARNIFYEALTSRDKANTGVPPKFSRA